MEAEIGVMQPEGTEHLQPPGAGRGKEQILPGASGARVALSTPFFLSTKSGDPSFWSSGLQNYERIPVVFSRRVCDNFLYRETDIPSTKSKRAAKPD